MHIYIYMSPNVRSSKRICLRNWNSQLLHIEDYSFENLAVHHTRLTEKAPLLDTHIDHLMGKGLFLTCQSQNLGSKRQCGRSSQWHSSAKTATLLHVQIPLPWWQRALKCSSTSNQQSLWRRSFCRSWWALLLPCSFGCYSRHSIINQYPLKTLQYISSSVLDTHEPWAIVDSRCKNGLYKISLTRTCIELEATLVVGIGLRLSQVSPCNSSRLPNERPPLQVEDPPPKKKQQRLENRWELWHHIWANYTKNLQTYSTRWNLQSAKLSLWWLNHPYVICSSNGIIHLPRDRGETWWK